MGNDATDEYMKENNKKAVEFCEVLEKFFPELDIYCPGRMDEFVTIAWKQKYLNEKQILDVDCVIVSRCNFLIAYSPDGFISSGMQIEIDFANRQGIPVLVIDDTQAKLGTIHRHLEGLKT